VVCTYCGQSLPDGSRFCFQCGRALGQESSQEGAVTCPGCGRTLAPGLRFCTACGTPLAGASPPPAAPRKSGVPAWGWVLIGCGSLAVLGIAAIMVVGYFSLHAFRPAMESMSETQTRASLTAMRNAAKTFYAHCGAYPENLTDLAAGKPPKQGLVAQDGKVVAAPIKPESWRGPYLHSDMTFPAGIPLPPGVTALPFNMVTGGNSQGRDWSYEKTDPAKLGRVGMGSAATGKDKDGKPYSEW